MLRKGLGIDIGTTQISIYQTEGGLLLKEPNVAAIDIDTEKVLDAGNAALRLSKESPDRVRLCWPVWDPVVKCADILSAILQLFLRRALGHTLLRPHAMVSIPCDLTEAQINAVEDAVLAGVDDVKTTTSRKEKKIMHELVIAVVNQRFTDTAIEAARAAGATGATVFHTKSLNNARAEERMGTALPEQTDSIFFLTTEEFKIRIMEAVRDSAGLKTEGGAIIFSMPVDDLVGIGRFDGEIKED